jgi:hypothetical protein
MESLGEIEMNVVIEWRDFYPGLGMHEADGGLLECVLELRVLVVMSLSEEAKVGAWGL